MNKNVTLTGVLIEHRGHRLRSQCDYETEPGRVFGAPHVNLYCETCRKVIWDKAIGAPVT